MSIPASPLLASLFSPGVQINTGRLCLLGAYQIESRNAHSRSQATTRGPRELSLLQGEIKKTQLRKEE